MGAGGFDVAALWVALTRDVDGDESVPCAFNPLGQWVPLVAADEIRLDWVRAEAERVSREQHRVIRIVKFSTRTDLEVIGGT